MERVLKVISPSTNQGISTARRWLGGNTGNGVVYELTPSGGGWTCRPFFTPSKALMTVARPLGGVIFDKSGNLYGVSSDFFPASGYGAVYQLSPTGSGWTEHTLYSFTGGNDGEIR